jgi:hypothetical protein
MPAMTMTHDVRTTASAHHEKKENTDDEKPDPRSHGFLLRF